MSSIEVQNEVVVCERLRCRHFIEGNTQRRFSIQSDNAIIVRALDSERCSHLLEGRELIADRVEIELQNLGFVGEVERQFGTFGSNEDVEEFGIFVEESVCFGSINCQL